MVNPEAVLPPIVTEAGQELCPDDAAMRRVAQDDSEALASLFERHKERLFGFLLHLLGDRALAEDLLGETFLHVYRARRTYRPGGGFQAWLYAIARNLALGELRRRSRWARFWPRLTAEQPAESCWDPAASDAQEAVRAALRRLPEEQRSAMVLREYLELDYAEIGQVLGCSEQAARARTYRARTALRELLREWWES